MKRIVVFLALLLLVPATVLARASHLTILHLNDLHSHLEVDAGLGGAAHIAGIVRAIETENRAKGFDTVVLVGGDVITGTIMTLEYQGEAEFAFLKALPVDALVVGNHEFDVGRDRLQALMASAGFPVISANIEDTTSHALFANPDVVVTEDDGLRIGIFGLTLESAAKSVFPENIRGLAFRNPIAVAKREVATLRTKSDLVIALTHEGVKADERLAAKVKGLAVVIGGHDHVKPQDYCREVSEIPVCQTPANGTYLGRVDIDLTGDKPKVESWQLIPIDAATPKDQEIARLVSGYADKIAAKYDVVIGRAKKKLTEHRGKPSTLGTLVAESMRKAFDADAAFLNSGGIRAPIDKGPIRLRDVVTSLPFANKLVIVTMKGEELKEIIEHAAQEKRSFPQMAGIAFGMQDQKVEGMTVAGEPLDPKKIYRVVTLDFVAAGSSGFEGMKRILKDRIEYTNRIVSDVFADYVRSVKTVKELK